MTNLSYSNLLKSPEWKKKRHKILVRDKFTCRKCHSHERLEVHHVAYKFGELPWDYPDYYFLTLCHICHETEGLNGSKNVIAVLSQIGFFESDFYNLAVKIARNSKPYDNLLEAIRNG